MDFLKRLICVILFFWLAFSCKPKHSIEAQIDGLGNDTIWVECMPVSRFFEMDEPVQDTIISSEGNFYYDIPSNETSILFMYPNSAEFNRTSGRPYRPMSMYIVVLCRSDDNINIQGNMRDLFIEYRANGSDFNENFSQVRQTYVEATSEAVLIELKLDTLMSNNGDKELINELFKKRNEISGASRIAQLKYIKNNLDKDLSAYYLTRQRLDTLGKYYHDLSDEVRSGSFKNMLESQFIKFNKFTKVREAELKIKEGTTAPDFNLSSLNEDDFTLSSLEKEYIVLDFWGSWCNPCIAGFPKMKTYYKKYSDQIEFVGIACNDNEVKWKKSVDQNQLPWIQLINNSEFEQDVSVKYGIKSYPTKFIIDREKNIVAKFVGEGDDFYQKLDELMKVN